MVSLDAKDPAAGHTLSKRMRFVTSHLISLTPITSVSLHRGQIFQSVGWPPLIANASAHSQASQHGFCGGHSVSGLLPLPILLFVSVSITPLILSTISYISDTT